MKKVTEMISSVIGRLTSIDGKPQQVAYGYALGIFLATTPLVGLKAVIAVVLTQLFRWKKIAAMIGVFHVNLFTAPFFYALSFFLGKSVMGYSCSFDVSGNPGMKTMLACLIGSKEVFISLTVGGLIIGIPLAFLAYKFTMMLLKRRKKILPAEGSYALITGASQGLGKDISYELAGRKFNVLLVALKGEGLGKLAADIKERYHVDAQFLETDLCHHKAVYQIADWAKPYQVSVLINNAGIGGTKGFEEASPLYIERIIQLNCRATSMLTRLMLPNLKMQPKAYIMNVASMASFSPIAFKTVYPASKAFIWSFSRCLSEELKGTNVFVSVLHPGPMKTNPDVTKRIVQQGFLGKIGLVTTPRMARIAISQLFIRKGTVIPGFLNKLNRIIMRMFPVGVRVRVLSNVFRRELQVKAA